MDTIQQGRASQESRRILVVTGASSQLASGLCRHLATNPVYDVIFQSRRPVDLQGVDLPPKSLFLGDLSDSFGVNTLVNFCLETRTHVDGIINFIGTTSNGLSWKLSDTEWQSVIDTNLRIPFLLARAFIPILLERPMGRIINVGSVAGTTGARGASHYAASKAGLIGFTKSVALELAKTGITVNLISPGYFAAGMVNSIPEKIKEAIVGGIPMQRLGNIDELRPAFDYLLSPLSSYVTGQNIQVNGALATS